MQHTLGTYLKEARKIKSLKIKELSALTSIDPAIISKIENTDRLPTDAQLQALSNALGQSYGDLRKHYLAEKIYQLLEHEDFAYESFILAEPRVEYLAGKKALDTIELNENTLRALAELDQLQAQWATLKGLSGIRREKMDEYFSLKYTYESNKIEGNTLTLSQTTAVIKDGITIAGKSIQDHLEAINHEEAIQLLYDLAKTKVSFSKHTLLQLHSIILRGINSRYAGTYRDVPVRITGSEHIPPQPFLLVKMMEDYFMYYDLHKSRLHPVILAAEMHERLVTIHPFIDGNGRTARLVMNLILVAHGFPIAILKGDDVSRQRYYDALSDVQIDKDPAAFYTLVIEALKASLEEHIELAR